MKFTEEELRKNFAENLSEMRKRSGMTQLELAEKLNYSDKSISKWERGDGIPDLYIASKIADLFGVGIDDIVGEKRIKKPFLFRNKLIVTVLSIGLAWLCATILSVLVKIIIPDFPAWVFFLFALPASMIVAVVFSYLWWNKICRFLSVSALIWSVPTTITALLRVSRITLLFAIAGVLQIMTVLWFLMKKNK